MLALGADPTGHKDSSAAFQSAIDQLRDSGGILYVPTGIYTVEKTVEWINTRNVRMPGIVIQGDGPYSSLIRSTVQSGPLLRIRGVAQKGPVITTFFWGGGIRDISFDGKGGGSVHDCLEVMGWWYGELFNCQISNFSRHGIRAMTDLSLNANPDFSASTLFVRGTWIQHCGGWGFCDDGGPQGAPAWSWDRCVFVLCKLGGAKVQSSSHAFTKCSFSACGWELETTLPNSQAYGLLFTGAATACSRQWVEGCEFDTNLTAHIAIRFLTSSSFVNNRFIFNDRYNAGRLCPSAGIQFGIGDDRATIQAVEFRQSFFRIDRPGKASGFELLSFANVRDITITRSVFPRKIGGLDLVRYRGFDSSRVKGFGYSIIDREMDEARSEASQH